MYAIRRIKDAFRENKNISDPEKIKSLVKKGQDSLNMMERQVIHLNYYFYVLQNNNFQCFFITPPPPPKKKENILPPLPSGLQLHTVL